MKATSRAALAGEGEREGARIMCGGVPLLSLSTHDTHECCTGDAGCAKAANKMYETSRQATTPRHRIPRCVAYRSSYQHQHEWQASGLVCGTTMVADAVGIGTSDAADAVDVDSQGGGACVEGVL